MKQKVENLRKFVCTQKVLVRSDADGIAVTTRFAVFAVRAFI